MTTIVTRAGKGSPLTHTEVDTNFTNLNTAKLEAGAIALGTAAAPSISFTGDTNTGVFSAGADQLAISTGGTRRLLVNGNNISVGAVDANACSLQIGDGATGDRDVFIDLVGDTTYSDYGARFNRSAGANGITYFAHRGTGAFSILAQDAAPVVISTSNTARLTVTSGGLVGLGTSTPSSDGPLTLANASLTPTVFFSRPGGGSYSAAIQASGFGTLTFYNGAESNTVAGLTSRMTINGQTGAVGIGTPTPGSKFDVNGSAVDFDAARFLNTNSDGSVATSSAIKLGITNTAGERYARIQATEIGGNNNNVSLDFYTNSSASPTGETIKMRIEHGGNVGIGTTDFGGKLTVRTSTSNGAPSAWDSGQLVVTTGTGTASLGIALSVNSTDNSASIISLTPLVTWNPIHYRASSHIFYKADATTNEVARIDVDGRLLVGTSSSLGAIPGQAVQKLQVAGSTDGGITMATFGADAFACNLEFRKSRNATVGTNTIVENGDTLGKFYYCGADGANYYPAAAIEAFVDGAPAGSSPGPISMPGRLVFSTTLAGASSPTSRMTINNAGDFYFNTTVTTKTFEGFRIENSGQPNVTRGLNGTFMQFFHAGTGSAIGSITNAGGTVTAYNTTSDYRLKENIAPLVGAIDRINNLQVRRFNFIADPDRTVDGFIAHEAQSVVPECVTGEKDAVDTDGNPVHQGIDQSKLVPLLTAALQEAIAKIEALETRLSALEAA